eukprot:72497_1
MRQLRFFEDFLNGIRDETETILSDLHWSSDELKSDTKYVPSCRFNSNHRVIAPNLKNHERRCLLKAKGIDPEKFHIEPSHYFFYKKAPAVVALHFSSAPASVSSGSSDPMKVDTEMTSPSETDSAQKKPHKKRKRTTPPSPPPTIYTVSDERLEKILRPVSTEQRVAQYRSDMDIVKATLDQRNVPVLDSDILENVKMGEIDLSTGNSKDSRTFERDQKRRRTRYRGIRKPAMRLTPTESLREMIKTRMKLIGEKADVKMEVGEITSSSRRSTPSSSIVGCGRTSSSVRRRSRERSRHRESHRSREYGQHRRYNSRDKRSRSRDSRRRR